MCRADRIEGLLEVYLGADPAHAWHPLGRNRHGNPAARSGAGPRQRTLMRGCRHCPMIARLHGTMARGRACHVSSRDGARPVAQRHKDGSTNAPAARMDARGSDGVATQHSARRRRDGTHDIARFGRDMQCAPLGARRRDLERDCKPTMAILTRTPNGPLRARSAWVWVHTGAYLSAGSAPIRRAW